MMLNIAKKMVLCIIISLFSTIHISLTFGTGGQGQFLGGVESKSTNENAEYPQTQSDPTPKVNVYVKKIILENTITVKYIKVSKEKTLAFVRHKLFSINNYANLVGIIKLTI